MLLYEIDQALAALLDQVDEETGELTCSMEDIEALMLERETALEGIALSIKNKRAEANAIADEIKKLTERKQALVKHADRLEGFLAQALAGEKFSTARVAVNYRSSTAVELAPDFVSKADLWWLRVPPPEPDKVKIKEALKNGQTVPGAELVTKKNMIIK